MSGSFEWDFSFFSLDGILIYVLAFFPARSTFSFHMLLVPLFCWTGCLRSPSSSTCASSTWACSLSGRLNQGRLRVGPDGSRLSWQLNNFENMFCNKPQLFLPTNTLGSGKLTKYGCLCHHRPDEWFFWSAENLRCCLVPANNGLPGDGERKQFYHYENDENNRRDHLWISSRSIEFYDFSCVRRPP